MSPFYVRAKDLRVYAGKNYPTVEIHLYAVVARGLPPEFYLPDETKQ